jgi:hypothetical protein
LPDPAALRIGRRSIAALPRNKELIATLQIIGCAAPACEPDHNPHAVAKLVRGRRFGDLQWALEALTERASNRGWGHVLRDVVSSIAFRR